MPTALQHQMKLILTAFFLLGALWSMPARAEEVTSATLAQHPSLAHYREVLGDKKRHLTIVALGDSNTEVNWTSRGHLNWTGLVQVGLFESGHAGRYTFINAGVSGDSTGDALARLERDVTPFHPDLVIITLGTNDALKGSAEQARTNLRTMIQRLRQQTPAPSLLLRTPQPIYDPQTKNYTEDPNLLAVVQAMREVAKEQNVALVDHTGHWFFSSMFQPETVMYDKLHPNEKGHRQFYAELAPVLGLKERFRWEKSAATP